MRVLKGAESATVDLAFSPDGRAIAAGFGESGVYLWNLEAANPAPVRLSDETGYKSGGLQFSADGRTLSWLSTETGYRKGALHFSADGRSLTWNKSPGLRTYNRDTLKYADHLFASRGGSHSMTASADGSRVVSQHGFPDHCLRGWRLADGEWVRTWSVSTADIAVASPTLSPDGSLLALLARDALGERWAANRWRVELRDAATGRVRGVGAYLHSYDARLAFAPDGGQLLGFNGMSLMIWRTPEPNGRPPRVIQNDNRKHFTSAAYHPSGRQLFATSNDTTVHVFDTATWNRAGRFTWKLGRLKAVAVSPDGTLAAAGGDRGDVVIWDLDV